MAASHGREYIQKLLTSLISREGFDKCLRNVKVLAAGNGHISATMKVEQEHTNKGRMLHGGMATTLVDVISGLAIMTLPESNVSGVSLNLNMSFLKAIPEGQEILIKASTDRLGRRIAFLSVDIIDKANGQVCVKGSHTKYLGG